MSDHTDIKSKIEEEDRRYRWECQNGLHRGKPKKVMAHEILEHLLSEENGVTKEELAETFGVCKLTITSRLRELRERGVKLVYGGFGIRVIGEVSDYETAELVNDNIKWFLNTAYAMASTSQNLRPLVHQMREYLPKTREERALVKQMFMRMSRLIDFLDYEDLGV